MENKLKFFPQIKEGRGLWGDRDKVCVFINIDFRGRGQLGRAAQPALCRYTDLAQKPQVYELIKDCVERSMPTSRDSLLAGSQISRFLVLHKELDADDGELTRTNKVRRGFIAEKYQVLVDALWRASPSQYIETQVKFEDGRTGKVSATLGAVGRQDLCPGQAAA